MSLLARGRLLRLPTRALVGLSNVVLPGKGLREGPFVSEAELLATADLAAQAEAIEARERAWIRSIIDFGDTMVRAVMVPRPDMVTVPAAATVREALDLAIGAGLSRLPARDPTIDEIAGLAYARDLMRAGHDHRGDDPVRPLLRPAHFVPETKRVAELLAEMQDAHFHMAIVVDEYGTTAGLVTLEDLVEELIGEITDEYDIGEPLIEPRGDRTVFVNGRGTDRRAQRASRHRSPRGRLGHRRRAAVRAARPHPRRRRDCHVRPRHVARRTGARPPRHPHQHHPPSAPGPH